jgi:hypothetical protein
MVLTSIILASSGINPNVGTSSIKNDLVSLIRESNTNFTNILSVLEIV